MTIDVTQILEAILALVAALFTGMVLPLVKRSMSEAKFQNLLKWLKIAVNAAEMAYREDEGKHGEEKKNYVKDFLSLHGFKYDEGMVDAAIESEVLEMKAKLGEMGASPQEDHIE